MNSFYRVIDSIKDAVSAEPFNHQVTFGDIADIDLQKQSLFPLCHIMINNATITNNLVQQSITIFLMDLVDISKTEDVRFENMLAGWAITFTINTNTDMTYC